MLNPLLPYCRFVVARAWRTDRVGVTTGCFLLALAFASSGAAFSQYRYRQQAQDSYARLGQIRMSSRTVAPGLENGPFHLNAFHSAELLDALNGAASTLALPVNEMVFRLDDSALRPYIRYTATVKLFGGYPVVRRFVDAVRKTLPQTSLDAISCTRTDIRSVHVSCELTLSTFYRREPNA